MEGSTRRLPKWMVGPSVSFADTNEDMKKKEKEKKTKENKRRAEEYGEPTNSFSLTKTKREKDDNDDGGGGDGLSRKVSKKRKPQNAVFTDEEDFEPDLTVEDLVTIAHEYVKLNHDSESRNTEVATCRTEHVQSTAACASEESLINVTRTGDPAQDMLHLFLGPLLKKPLESIKTQNVIDDIVLVSDLKNQNHNDAPQQMLPLSNMKKKTSLKNKVSLFLD
ncbi:conserved hypothetical protein [Ricinus communis]|uniref:Uncharacterized protein n=1 Tax=Ricinus communis TaxID=3988 RepID=B9RY50_RICCO|nr:conserved hypothetical protein [Ricinus communis]|eukprot:XP_002518817.1 uncharacterized protein LOC8275354 [Ricinus communis]